MGRKLDGLLGKAFNASKFKKLANAAIPQIAYHEKLHKVRCSQVRADVVQLLTIREQKRALLPVEHVIREQNMLDAYATKTAAISLWKGKCPDELKEAVSSLVFAASRCGELPELLKVRQVFTSRFGKEFATGAEEEVTVE